MTPHPLPASIDGPRGPDRDRALEHVAACAACRAALAADDASRLFGLLAVAPIDGADLDRIAANVGRHLVSARPPIVEAVRDAFLPRAVAAAAVLALAVATGAATLWMRPAGRPPAAAAGERAGVTVTATAGSARVVDLAVGDVQVVMIFDSEMAL